MPIYNPLEGNIKYQYVNPDIPAGNTILSSVSSNPKTAFISSTTIPEVTAIIGGIANITGSGLYGSGIISLGLTVSVEMAGSVVATTTVTPALSLTNMPWNINVVATILNSGLIEVTGQASFSSSLTAATLVNIRNTSSYSMSTVGGVPVTISVTWGTLALGGTITLRQMTVNVT